jgi:hypothetical protein
MLLGDIQDQARTSTLVDSSLSVTGSMDILKLYHIVFFEHTSSNIKPYMEVHQTSMKR